MQLVRKSSPSFLLGNLVSSGQYLLASLIKFNTNPIWQIYSAVDNNFPLPTFSGIAWDDTFFECNLSLIALKFNRPKNSKKVMLHA